MDLTVKIRAARMEDLASLPEIERRAAARFADIGLPAAVDLPLQAEADLRAACDDDRLLVAVDVDEVPVGFAVLAIHGTDGHLQELDVMPSYSGRGIGRLLIAASCTWARSRRCTRLTLTTFRDVPFNAPFYARAGFVVIDESDLTPDLRALRDSERAHGVELAPRVAMSLPL